MSSSIFQKNEVDKIWVSPLLRAQQTLEPFKKAGVSEDITVHEWLQEMRDSEEVDLIGKPNNEIEEFFIKRNSKSFEEWLVTNHGEYMKEFSDNIITNLGVSLNELGVVSIDNKYDRLFELKNNETEKAYDYLPCWNNVCTYFLFFKYALISMDLEKISA